ncbi:CHAT domain-containing protein [Actinoplanes sp. HUAS TT8]|uniref:CHAT domain-containing protein n=1 Tax=Actinoplanes sp. HUAS TT8 TaxID=3447453 RepID=UPI003F51BBBB
MADGRRSWRSRLDAARRTHRATRLLQMVEDVDDPRTLDWVIDTFTDLLAEIPAGHSSYTIVMNNLGIAVGIRFTRLGDRRDLTEQVRLCRLNLELAAPKQRPGRLTNLATALARQAVFTDDPARIDDAVDAAGAAVTEAGPGHRDRALHLSTLASVLAVRHELTGSAGDLDAGIEASAGAVQAARNGDPQLANHLDRLAETLISRHARDGDPGDLDAAIDASRLALAATDQATYGNRAGWLPHLSAMLDRLNRDLVEMSKDHREPPRILRRGPDEPGITGFGGGTGANPASAGRLLALSRRLLHRHATGVESAAITVTPPLAEAAATSESDADLREALDGLEKVAAAEEAPAGVRLAAAERRAAVLVETSGPEAALTAYIIGIDLLPLLAWRGIGQRDQQQRLRSHASLARDAAACAIAAGRPGLAVELLEQGRGVSWAQLLGTRTDLSALESDHAELAGELSDCRRILESAQVTTARHQAARRFDELVGQVRDLAPTAELAHPEEFLRPPAVSRLLPPDDTGPVVLLNVSTLRCDALILTAAGVEIVALPDLTATEVAEVADRQLTALDGNPSDRDATVTGTLDWLWQRIAGPVLRHLGHTETPGGDWPRVWWCPTGLLTALPIHAAGPSEGGPGVPDLVVSSYTPTVRALDHARRRAASQRPARMLVASLPRTPGQRPLPGAVAERRHLTARIAPQSRTVLDDAAADRSTLLTELTRHRWFHASCHGTQSLADPSSGGLVPYDWETSGLVSVVDLADARHHDGELAFLSACRTATGGTGTPDEAITVAAAMQHAGWRHVVGTLWSIPDDAAAAVTRGFYTAVAPDGEPLAAGAALALHQVLHRLRTRDRARPSAWAAFLHLGP